MHSIVPPRRAQILILAALVLPLAPSCSKAKHPASPSPSASSAPASSPSKSSEIQSGFAAQGVRAVDSQDRPQANQAATQASNQVVAVLNSYYNIAFLQPKKWGGGTHPDLAGLFTDEARHAVAADLQTLALGSVAPRLGRVDPSKQTAGVISVLIEPDLSGSYAAATVDFEGTGRPTASGEAPIKIVQTGQFMFAKVGGDYKIAGYDLHLTEETTTTGAASRPLGHSETSARWGLAGGRPLGHSETSARWGLAGGHPLDVGRGLAWPGGGPA